ncbi:hypothetical protein IPN41_03445 [Candidatus Falkowbacteria bacterium]|nr:MAG: hypothetical protein IPN41_03445 [Candidatus Falkowbacteria bacterium]
MPNIEQFPNNQVPEQENNEKTPESELEAENNKKVEEKESWLSRNKRKLVFGATAYGMLTAAVQGKELKNTANEEFSKVDKTELLQDNVENQENPLFPVLTKVRLGELEEDGDDNNLKLIKKMLTLSKLYGWSFSNPVQQLIRREDLTPEDEAETIEIVVVDPLDLGLGADATYQELLNKMKDRGIYPIQKPVEVMYSMMRNNVSDINWPKADSILTHKDYIFAMDPSNDITTGDGDRVYRDMVAGVHIKGEKYGDVSAAYGEFTSITGHGYNDLIPWNPGTRYQQAIGKYKDKALNNNRLPAKYLGQRNVKKGNYYNKK